MRKQVKCTNCGFLGLSIPTAFVRQLIKLGASFSEMNELLKTKECTSLGRQHIEGGTHDDPGALRCSRNQWSFSLTEFDKSQELRSITSRRTCKFFFPYSPGYSPEEHKELLREAQNRKWLLWAALLGASVGALAAIFTQTIWEILRR